MVQDKLNFFRSKHRPYYIATGEWTQKSAGFRLPFILCHSLNELGFEAYVIAQNQAPSLRTPLLTPEIVKKHKEDNRETIAVYTEAMWGNTLKGDIVVQWMLNKAGRVVDISIEYKDTIRFYYDELYSTNDTVPQILKLPCIDDTIFYIDPEIDKVRNGFAYYANKYLREGNNTIPDILKENGISLCQDIPRTSKEIADILRRVKALYVYEDTAITAEASLCGCNVVLIETNFCQNLSNSYRNLFDHCVRENEIDVGNSYPVNGLSKTYKTYKEEYCEPALKYLLNFINITQNAPVKKTIPDRLVDFFINSDDIFIYGAGLIAGLLHNLLIFGGISIHGFVVSDEHFTKTEHIYRGLPVISLSQFALKNAERSKLILAMSIGNINQVIPKMDNIGIKYIKL